MAEREIDPRSPTAFRIKDRLSFLASGSMHLFNYYIKTNSCGTKLSPILCFPNMLVQTSKTVLYIERKLEKSSIEAEFQMKNYIK